METRPCGQLAPPGSAPRPGPGVAEAPRRGASDAWSRKKALVLVRTRRPSACSLGPPGGSAADEPDKEHRADAGSTPGGAPDHPAARSRPRLPWGQAAMGAATDFCRAAQYPCSLRCLQNAQRLLSSVPATPPAPGCRPPTARTLVSTVRLNKEPSLRPGSRRGCASERSGQPRGPAPGHSSGAGPGHWPGMSGRVPLAERALSEGHARRRYRDTSLLIWQQQQRKLESVPPGTYLSRSRSMWYSQYGNEAILVRDRNKLEVSRDTGQSRFCSVM